MFNDYIHALNNLQCINNTYKVVHLVMVLIGMNCCWGGFEGQVIMLALLQQWQITRSDRPSQIAYRNSNVNRFLGLLSDLLIVLLALTMIPIIFDHVNFFCPWIFVFAAKPNILDDVHIQQPPSGSSKLLPLVSQGGLELKENICVDGQCCIEHCPFNFAIQCSILQKTTKLKCKARINLCKSIKGTHAPCDLGFCVQ
jgi:hypothetical protein